MKLRNYKLSEIKKFCAETECFLCPYQDIENRACFFAFSRLPCQWKIENEKNDDAELLENVTV